MLSATLQEPVEIAGRGLFSGVPCHVLIEPSEAGLTLRRGEGLIPVHPDNFIARSNCSVLGAGGSEVAVTEHILAALWAAGIDSAQILVHGPEMPNHDGSSYTLYELIISGGRRLLGERPNLTSELPPIRLEDGDSSIEWEYSSELTIEYEFRHKELGQQHCRFADLTREDAARKILPARTFITEAEAQAAIDAGLLRNSHAEDALVIRNGQPSSALRFPDEFSRHKILDLLGDLYPLPYELCGKINCQLSGHKLNRALARELLRMMQEL